jgi:hypothetical protein
MARCCRCSKFDPRFAEPAGVSKRSAAALRKCFEPDSIRVSRTGDLRNRFFSPTIVFALVKMNCIGARSSTTPMFGANLSPAPSSEVLAGLFLFRGFAHASPLFSVLPYPPRLDRQGTVCRRGGRRRSGAAGFSRQDANSRRTVNPRAQAHAGSNPALPTMLFPGSPVRGRTRFPPIRAEPAFPNHKVMLTNVKHQNGVESAENWSKFKR